MKDSVVFISVQKTECGCCKKEFFESEDWQLEECPYCGISDEFEEVKKFTVEATIDHVTGEISVKYNSQPGGTEK